MYHLCTWPDAIVYAKCMTVCYMYDSICLKVVGSMVS